ncbi:hypothetical protein JG688_00003908 [Phytophthora aleatoria]|uniref:Crinkler (CRN) family protein n=1 Tax=Phytophthora aleatoria TaxID=2496075 RepID=A0A8J5MHD7_9STRA|nr:hypothetical protein JG688_00003908 [Phytophthora aleatoria]
MDKVKSCLVEGADCNMVVTGNPGTGLSRFYLYCTFHLTLRTKLEVKELSSFKLVVNYNKQFHKFDAEIQGVIELSEADVSSLQEESRVTRLIDGRSSELAGWQGVSILFASPGAEAMRKFSKVDTFRYIMPVWTVEELRDYSSLLQDELKLSDDV